MNEGETFYIYTENISLPLVERSIENSSELEIIERNEISPAIIYEARRM